MPESNKEKQDFREFLKSLDMLEEEEIINNLANQSDEFTTFTIGSYGFSMNKGPPDPILGENIGSLGLPDIVDHGLMKQILEMYFDKSIEFKDATELVRVLLVCKNHLPEIHNFYLDTFMQAEEHMFKPPCSSSMNMKEGIIHSNSSSLLTFHILRAYVRAEQGKFEDAERIWNSLDLQWRAADPNRVTHLVLHLFMTRMCMSKFSDAIYQLHSLWSNIRFASNSQRHDLAQLDNWTCSLLVLWFFAKHSKQFRDYFIQHNEIKTPYYLYQKKSIILHYLDTQFFVDLMSKPYYELARKSNQSMPVIE